nr:MAG TPA: contryphan [Caudoviricetes sp.]
MPKWHKLNLNTHGEHTGAYNCVWLRWCGITRRFDSSGVCKSK